MMVVIINKTMVMVLPVVAIGVGVGNRGSKELWLSRNSGKEEE